VRLTDPGQARKDRRIAPIPATMMKRPLLVLATLVVYVLHQDVWFWTSAGPFVFGFLPIGLFYHLCYAVLASLLMWLLVACAWPEHLEREAELPHEDRRP
jgi:Protein of unknown function (DUF3311)